MVPEYNVYAKVVGSAGGWILTCVYMWRGRLYIWRNWLRFFSNLTSSAEWTPKPVFLSDNSNLYSVKMREIVHIQAGQCGNQIGAKVN